MKNIIAHPQLTKQAAKSSLMSLVLALAMLVPNLLFAAGPAPIDLKSCNAFAILAYSTITSVGGGNVDGDVGLFPAGSISGFPPATINGTFYNGGPIAAQAQSDLNDAIIAASPAVLPGGTDVGAELGGQTLAAGVYTSPSGAYGITSLDLTLSGGPEDVWVFQMASTLTVGAGRQVLLAGGAQARNVFWQVGSSVTLDTSSSFKGTILAYASITMNASSTLEGRALAQIGAVTFNGTGGSLPVPLAPLFTQITKTDNGSEIVVLTSTPYYPLTLESCPDLMLANWAPLATETPVVSLHAFTNDAALPAATQLFYRAFVTPYPDSP